MFGILKGSSHAKFTFKKFTKLRSNRYLFKLLKQNTKKHVIMSISIKN